MAQVIQASELTLHDVKEKFNLQQVDDEQFFREWQDNLPEVTDGEKQWLDRVKADFISISEYALHEEVVKMVVLAPLLSLAGFFRYPFHPDAEVQVAAKDEEEIVRGKIDVLVLKQQLWVAVVEAKNKQFSVDKALPQALFYMLKNPHPSQPTFGLATNGSHFMFIKLMRQDTPQYGLSDEFTLRRRGNELYQVLAVLKRWQQTTIAGNAISQTTNLSYH
ncbi:restriction endonuclease subunit R [Coleofasciculus sp.]|uniref:restriction endonuclease subunit R n=1 Tax=Coleofasciculus sp. TaxID=3100458 RepID=UPI003A43FE1A